MLFPKKVKHRKWFTKRMHPVKEANHADTRGTTVAFGSFGLKAMEFGRVTSNQLEAARKVMARYATKSGKVWIRVFPDHPFTQKPAEVKMGKGKGELVGFVALVKPGCPCSNCCPNSKRCAVRGSIHLRIRLTASSIGNC